MSDHWMVIRYSPKTEIIGLKRCNDNIMLIVTYKTLRILDVAKTHKEIKKIELMELYERVGLKEKNTSLSYIKPLSSASIASLFLICFKQLLGKSAMGHEKFHKILALYDPLSDLLVKIKRI